jgi:hypothetical protein
LRFNLRQTGSCRLDRVALSAGKMQFWQRLGFVSIRNIALKHSNYRSRVKRRQPPWTN